MKQTSPVKVVQPPTNNTPQVDEFMEKLVHPYKAEIQALREIFKGVNKDIAEEIKWNAPSFGYKEYFVTFNLHAQDKLHLIFHNGIILKDTSGLLEGNFPDRRMAYFYGMEDITAKKPILEKLIKEWVKIMDAKKE